MTKSDTPYNWLVSREHVLEELKRLGKTQEVFRDKLIELQVDVATLKVKSGIWGLIGGSIPVIIAIAYILLNGIN